MLVVMSSAFWDYSRCPWWYTPAALFWRCSARFVCWAKTRHEPVNQWSSDYDLYGDNWFHKCGCGYFGHLDPTITGCLEEQERGSSDE